MSTDQLISLANSAADRGDYAQAYAAELELTNNPDPEISRQAMRRVGFRIGEGQGVSKNLAESHRISLQAASLGDITAHQHVCTNYMEGYGVQENHQKAIEYCLIAAEKGDAVAQANLGWLYESGKGVQRSERLSDIWTCKAASQGQPTAVNNVKKANIRCN
jgi:TPR repeat protein